MPLIAKTKIKVRFEECDFYQHVNNTKYMTYMDVGLADFLRQIWPDLLNLEILFHKVHLSMDFVSSATFDDDLIVESYIEEIGNTSLTFKQTIYKNEKIITQAKTIFVLINAKSGEKCTIPKLIKDAILN